MSRHCTICRNDDENAIKTGFRYVCLQCIDRTLAALRRPHDRPPAKWTHVEERNFEGQWVTVGYYLDGEEIPGDPERQQRHRCRKNPDMHRPGMARREVPV